MRRAKQCRFGRHYRDGILRSRHSSYRKCHREDNPKRRGCAPPFWSLGGAGGEVETPPAFLLGVPRGRFSFERESPPLPRAAPMALHSPRTFVQKIKKRRLFQPSLLYLHYCKTFLLPWVAFMRSSLLRIVLRMRRFLGVTSSSSSSARNSRHCSRLICLGGTRRSASSEPEARMFVSCFFLHTLTVMSSCLGD